MFNKHEQSILNCFQADVWICYYDILHEVKLEWFIGNSTLYFSFLCVAGLPISIIAISAIGDVIAAAVLVIIICGSIAGVALCVRWRKKKKK